MRRGPAHTPQRAGGSAFRAVGQGGAFLLGPTGREVDVLNPVASRVYELIDGKRTVEELVNIIAGEYEVSPEQAAIDVDDFLAVLEGKGLLAAGAAAAGKEAIS